MKIIRTTVPGFPEATLEGYLLDCEITLVRKQTALRFLCCPVAVICTVLPGRRNLLPSAIPPGAFMPSCCAIPPVMMRPVLLR